MTSHLDPARVAAIVRGLLAVALVLLMVTGIVASRLSPQTMIAEGERLIAAIHSLGLSGVALFAAMQIVIAMIGVVPASLSAIAAGIVYGLLAGFVLTVGTTAVAAYFAFVFSRSLFRPTIARMLSHHPKFRSLDGLVAADGWKLVCLLRISPVMPFAATSYALGLSNIRLRDYFIGNCASLPAMFGYVAIGALTNAGLAAWSQSESPVRWFMFVGGGLATIALGIWLAQAVLKLRVAS